MLNSSGGDADLFNSDEEDAIMENTLNVDKKSNKDELLDSMNKLIQVLDSHIQSCNLKEIYSFRLWLETDLSQQNPILSQKLFRSLEFKTLLQNSEKLLHEFRNSLSAGIIVDCFHPKYLKWFEAKILSRDDNSIRLHYMSWSSKFDESIDITQYNFLPANSFTKSKKKPEKKKRTSHVVEIIEDPDNEISNTNDIPKQPEKENVLMKSGRVKRAVVKDLDIPKNEQKNKNSISEPPRDKNDWLCSICMEFESYDDSDLVLCDGLCRRSFHMSCLNFDLSQISSEEDWKCESCRSSRHDCFICHEEGADDVDVFKCRVTTCGKFYHINCMLTETTTYEIIKKDKTMPATNKPSLRRDSIDSDHRSGSKKKTKTSRQSSVELPNGGHEDSLLSQRLEGNRADTPFSSHKDSLQDRHANSAGGANTTSPSTDDFSSFTTTATDLTEETDSHDEVQLEVEGEVSGIHTRAMRDGEGALGDVGEEVNGEEKVTFRCPYHKCDVCSDFYGKVVDKRPLEKCIRCPRSYHDQCMPPNCQFNQICLLCPNHPNDRLPLELTEARAGNVVVKDVGKYSSVTMWTKFPLPFSVPRPDVVTDNHFRLPISFKDAKNQKVPEFKHIWQLDYSSLPAEKEKLLGLFDYGEDVCECKDKCGERCMNRMLKIECCKFSGHDNCAVGEECGNRHFSNNEYVRVQPFREENRGWGLRCLDNVSAGTLVIEYLGEVITKTQMEDRMAWQKERTPRDKDFYVMELGNGLYVDGKKKGNMSRFINHSCDPNCELVRWVVKGRYRIGIFAKKNISANESLSYDYQFDTIDKKEFRCFCCASSCRGTMAPTSRSDALLSRIDKAKVIAKKKREEVEEMSNDWKRSYTGKRLPGDGVLEVTNGPPHHVFPVGTHRRFYLKRNARRGFDFVARWHWFKQIGNNKNDDILTSPGPDSDDS